MARRIAPVRPARRSRRRAVLRRTRFSGHVRRRTDPGTDGMAGGVSTNLLSGRAGGLPRILGDPSVLDRGARGLVHRVLPDPAVCSHWHGVPRTRSRGPLSLRWRLLRIGEARTSMAMASRLVQLRDRLGTFATSPRGCRPRVGVLIVLRRGGIEPDETGGRAGNPRLARSRRGRAAGRGWGLPGGRQEPGAVPRRTVSMSP
jgi:hypothetical protein